MTRRGNGDHPMAVAVRRQPPLWRPTFDPTASQVEFVGDKVSLGRVARLDPTVAQVEFVVDKVAEGQVALLVLRVSPASTILIHSLIAHAL